MGRTAGFEAASLGQYQLPWGMGGEIAAVVLSPEGVDASRGSWRPEEAPAGCRVRWGEAGGLQVPSRPGAPGTPCSGAQRPLGGFHSGSLIKFSRSGLLGHLLRGSLYLAGSSPLPSV